MRKKLSVILTLVFLLSMTVTPAYAIKSGTEGVSVHQEGDFQVITITGEENIRQYQETIGEEYDPNLLMVQRRIDVRNPTFGATHLTKIDTELEPNWLIRELVIREKITRTYTDFTQILRQYNRPSGRVLIDESVTISNTFTADAGISASFLEASLGFSIQETNTFRIEWEEEYEYAVKIKVYPIYEVTKGEVWDDDVREDDFIGAFAVYRAVGDDIRVYRA